MSTAAINIGRVARRRRGLRAMGDDYALYWDPTGGGGGVDQGAGGPDIVDIPLPSSIPGVQVPPTAGTVSVPQLQQQNQQGAFNDLQTPGLYTGTTSSQWNDPYGNPTIVGRGPNGALFTAYLPTSGDGVGGGGSVIPIDAPTLKPVTGQPATNPTGALATAESWFSQPIYTGSPITWGWALLGGLALWLLLRK